MSLDQQEVHRTLSLMPTFRCTAACRSCGTLSSPQVSAHLTMKEAMGAIRQASEAGIELVVFTGGEATLEPEVLFAGLRLAKELGMMTRLVTNAHWANSESDATDFITDLREAGLDEINYSTGDQHARFVPVQHVLFAIRAAVASDMAPAVMVETTALRQITRASLEQDSYHIETTRRFPGRLVKFSESPWMPLKPTRVESYPDHMAITRTNISRTRGCDSVLQTVTVQADGKIGACCGLGMRLIPELYIGKLGETSIAEAIEEGEQDLLKRWIRLEGPERILAWAAEKDPNIDWEGQYAHRCQACLRLYKDESVRAVIEKHYMEKMPDVIYGEFLLYHFRNAAGDDLDSDN